MVPPRSATTTVASTQASMRRRLRRVLHAGSIPGRTVAAQMDVHVPSVRESRDAGAADAEFGQLTRAIRGARAGVPVPSPVPRKFAGGRLEFRILGPLDVVGPDGPEVVRGTKRRGLLAYLLVHAGEAVSLDRLVEDLYDERSSAGARGTVQTYLSQLRKLLADGSGVTLETRPSGYALGVPADRLDAARFERLCAEAGTEADATTRLTMLDAALDLWRGAPLGEFAGSAWADVEAARLGALRLQALQRRIDARLDLGHDAETIPELERLAGEHPLDEHFWAQLMVAYYRAGRQADALRACQRARSPLADELGVEPAAELQDLEHRILHHDPELMLARPGPASTDACFPEGVVTFLLTDIEGSTPLWDHDPEAMSSAIARHEELVTHTVRSHRGWIVN